MTYEHTQSGWPVRIALGVAAIVMLAMTQIPPLHDPVARIQLVIGAAIAAAIGLLWGSMTIRIDGRDLHWSFGPGWPRFSLPLAEIDAVDVTRTTFWQGWGVHRTRQGWLYNIAGFDAVRIVRKDGKQTLLGTDEPRRLRAALERAIIAKGSRA